MNILNLEDHIQKILKNHFTDSQDTVVFVDEKGDGRHFFLKIISPQFTDKNRIERTRQVNKILAEYLGTGMIHALRTELKSPAEV